MGSKKHKKHKGDAKPLPEFEGQEKSLKLVLKVGGLGGGQDGAGEPSHGSPILEERRHKHKKKKKKRSSDKERPRYAESEVSLKRPLEVEDSENEEEVMTVSEPRDELDQKPYHSQEMEESDGNSSPNRKLREPRACTVRDSSDGMILKQMLNYLLKNLQNKDVHGFFAFPVTDKIAPGYSTIIQYPMDFSKMATKIEAFEYNNVMEFKADFISMCNNAMIYNRPDTIYHKEAKRLHVLGTRQLSKEKLLNLKKMHSFLAHITLQELGFDESGHTVESVVHQPLHEEHKEKFREDFRPVEDVSRLDLIQHEDLGPEEILAQAQSAAKKAHNTLSARKPKTDLGFLRMDDDGTTTMTVLNPWNDGKVSSKQKIISLGDYMGKLKAGSGSLFKYKEDKRNKINTETYLCYGPFSSHAPTYDSSFASCTKDESDLLLSTYGGEVGVQYAKSVQKFVDNSGLSAIEMVNKLLDTLTNDQHSKAKVLQEQQKRREEEQAQRALQDEMIARAQKAAEEAAAESAAEDEVQQNLDETAQLLQELSETQKERLSKDPPSHISSIAPPCNKEADLADQVTNSLMHMTKRVHPADVVSVKAVRGAMGITVNPMIQSTGSTGAGQQDRAASIASSVDLQDRESASNSDDSDKSDDDMKDDSGDDDNDNGDEGNGSTYGEEGSDLNLPGGYDDLVQHMIDENM